MTTMTSVRVWNGIPTRARASSTSTSVAEIDISSNSLTRWLGDFMITVSSSISPSERSFHFRYIRVRKKNRCDGACLICIVFDGSRHTAAWYSDTYVFVHTAIIIRFRNGCKYKFWHSFTQSVFMPSNFVFILIYPFRFCTCTNHGPNGNRNRRTNRKQIEWKYIFLTSGSMFFSMYAEEREREGKRERGREKPKCPKTKYSSGKMGNKWANMGWGFFSVLVSSSSRSNERKRNNCQLHYIV